MSGVAFDQFRMISLPNGNVSEEDVHSGILIWSSSAVTNASSKRSRMLASFMFLPMNTTSWRLSPQGAPSYFSRAPGGHSETSAEPCSQREPASILTDLPAWPQIRLCCGELATQMMPFDRRMPSEPELCSRSMRAGWNGRCARKTKLEMLYSSVSGTWFPVSSWTQPGIFSVSARSKLPVSSRSLGSALPKLDRTILALGLSLPTIDSRRSASSGSTRSILFSTTRFAHSTWSASRSGMVRGSAPSAPSSGRSLSLFPSS
mmetsp:Transcript_103129/g.292149  ORF Transcript_103129/g.292149 Transcript_103129/m.292149 type:complete len:261 (+) Transcript_103129:336-1118(+)